MSWVGLQLVVKLLIQPPHVARILSVQCLAASIAALVISRFMLLEWLLKDTVPPLKFIKDRFKLFYDCTSKFK